MRGLALGTALTVVHGGCAYNYPTVTSTSTVHSDGEVRLRTDRLPGKGELAADGSFRFTLDESQLCQRDRIARRHTEARRKREFTPFGLGLTVASGALFGLSTYDFAANQEEATLALSIPSMFAGVVGVTLLVMLRYGRVAPVVRDDGVRTEVESTADVPCNDAAGAGRLGRLRLTTPWGSEAFATVSKGTASFSIDWSSAPVDGSDAQSRTLAGQPWKIRAEKSGLVARWQPAEADVALVFEFAGEARNRVVTGATPASLVVAAFSVDGDALVIGGTSRLRLTLENRGKSTAVDVVATTRSGLPAVHGVSFSFGKIQPGQRLTRTVDVKLASDTRGDSATIVLVFSEGGGHAPAEHTQKVLLVRAVCPDGALTREQYDKKRAKLQKAVEDGSISQDDFDRYDAELVRCLE